MACPESSHDGRLVEDVAVVADYQRYYDLTRAPVAEGRPGGPASGVAGLDTVTASPDLSTAGWRTSSHSNNDDGGVCVEVAVNVPGTVPVRDSKDPDGPALLFTAPAWSAFVTAVQAGSSAFPDDLT